MDVAVLWNAASCRLTWMSYLWRQGSATCGSCPSWNLPLGCTSSLRCSSGVFALKMSRLFETSAYWERGDGLAWFLLPSLPWWLCYAVCCGLPVLACYVTPRNIYKPCCGSGAEIHLLLRCVPCIISWDSDLALSAWISLVITEYIFVKEWIFQTAF